MAKRARSVQSPKRSLPRVPAAAARRLLLSGLGLIEDPGRRATAASVYALVERMGYVQVDTINVIARAHDHILFTRFDGYRPPVLARLLERDRKLFEHWTRDMAVIPTRWFGHWRLRFHGLKRRIDDRGYLRKRMGPDPEKLQRYVLKRIRDEGPLMSRDFEHDGPRNSHHWHGAKPQGAVLDYLLRVGQISISRREKFQKVFDLTERVIPGAHEVPESTREEHLDWACRGAIERLVVGAPGELAKFFDGISAKDATRWCRERVAEGQLVEVEVEAVDDSRPRRAFALPDWERRAARVSDAPERTRLLSPFEPAIHDRARTERLFGFDYRVEIFVPPKQRKYGYYVLPILEGDRLVGRLNPRLDRERDVLDVQKLWWETGIKPTRARRTALERAVDRLAEQIGASRWSLPDGKPR